MKQDSGLLNLEALEKCHHHLFLKESLFIVLGRRLQKAKENFNTSFTQLTKTIPTMWKHLVLMNIEESRPNLLTSELIAITAVAAMNEYLKM